MQQARAFAEQNLNFQAQHKTQLFQKAGGSRHESAKKSDVLNNSRTLIANSLSQEKESMGNHLISYQPKIEAFQTPQRSVDDRGFPGESPFIH